MQQLRQLRGYCPQACGHCFQLESAQLVGSCVIYNKVSARCYYWEGRKFARVDMLTGVAQTNWIEVGIDLGLLAIA